MVLKGGLGENNRKLVVTAVTGGDASWTVVLTQAQAEWQVYCALLRQGVEALLPWTLASSRRGRWAHGVVRPLYPGYLFVRMSVPIETVKRTAGVRDVLKLDSGRMVVLRGEEVDVLRDQWSRLRDEAMPTPAYVHRVAPGDLVEVPAGPLIGLPVTVQSVDKSGLVTASIGQLTVTFHLPAGVRSVRGSAKPATI